MRSRVALAAVLWLSAGSLGCGSSAPSGVATDPAAPAEPGTPAGGSASAAGGGGARTILASLGINVREGPSHTAKIVGSAARATQLTVLGHVDDDGGWYQVRGQTTTGWITADPDLSADGTLSEVSIEDKRFSALYPADWTYVNTPGETIFQPQKGDASIVVRPLPSLAALGQPGLPGYRKGAVDTVVACGYTGLSTQYAADTPGSPQPTTDAKGGKVTRLGNFAQLLLQLDPASVLDLEFNYASRDQLRTFRDFYNGITYPFPQCKQVAPPASAAPAPPVPT